LQEWQVAERQPPELQPLQPGPQMALEQPPAQPSSFAF
jgi:hypothetical protein